MGGSRTDFTKRRQKARARPPGGPVESRKPHARRAESDRTKRKTNTNTAPHTHAYTTSQTRVYTPNPTAQTEQQESKVTHTHSECRESLQGGPTMKESNVAGSRQVWVGHVQTKRRQKARARPPRGPVESRKPHARRAESDRTKRKTNTNTTPHTPQAKHVCTRPTPLRTHRTTTEQSNPHNSELAERAAARRPHNERIKEHTMTQ